MVAGLAGLVAGHAEHAGAEAVVLLLRVGVEVPGELLRAMNLRGVGVLRVRINASLSHGARLVSWTYSAFVVVEPLSVEVSGGRVVLYNPNPFCLDANVTVLWANRVGPWT
ncbi:MAG: hypothetical protein ACK4YP_10150, partial [Myxococcota bacterium]